MRVPRFVLTAVFAFLAVTLAGAQAGRDNAAKRPAPPATASVSGTITAQDDSGRPLRRVSVALAASDLKMPMMAITDERGVFTFTGVPAGAYTLGATKASYVPAFYGARRPGRGPGVPIAILEGQQLTGVSLRMLRGSVITGMIRQASGLPASGINVQVSEVLAVSQRKAFAMIEPVQTDDRGIYRFYGLAPGRYTVKAIHAAYAAVSEARRVTAEEVQWATRATASRATAPGTAAAPLPPAPSGGATLGLAPVYFPGTPDAASAGVVAVGPGEEKAGVDFVLTPVPTARVSGVVLDPEGRPFAGARVTLPVESTNDPMEAIFSMVGGAVGAGATSGADGTFTLRSVVPGRYKVMATGTPRPAPGQKPPDEAMMMEMMGMMTGSSAPLWANDEILVDGRDVTGLTLRMQPGMVVTGKVVIDAPEGTPPPDFKKVRVSFVGTQQASNPFTQMMSSMMGGGGTPATEDGTFTIKGLLPDRYRVTASMPGLTGGWVLKSAVLNGVDVADVPHDLRPGQDLTGLTVTLVNRTTELSGTVIDPAGRPTGGFPIVVFSSNRAHWAAGSRRVQQARPSSDGKYKVSVPAGEYFLAAVTELEQGDLADAAFLEQLAAAAFKITLADGEKKQQDVKLGGG